MEVIGPNRDDVLAYSSEAFLQKFSVGKTTLHQEINAGRLKAVRIGKKLLIRHDDAMAWLNSLPQRKPSSPVGRAA